MSLFSEAIREMMSTTGKTAFAGFSYVGWALLGLSVVLAFAYMIFFGLEIGGNPTYKWVGRFIVLFAVAVFLGAFYVGVEQVQKGISVDKMFDMDDTVYLWMFLAFDIGAVVIIALWEQMYPGYVFETSLLHFTQQKILGAVFWSMVGGGFVVYLMVRAFQADSDTQRLIAGSASAMPPLFVLVFFIGFIIWFIKGCFDTLGG